MYQPSPFPIVDLFAGPGGLGEGFASLDDGNAFRILVSAEMEKSAHQTLLLRSFYRILKRQGDKALESYYRFCHGESDVPYDTQTFHAWQEAKGEARCLTLGTEQGNRELNLLLDSVHLDANRPWVLIGGPPCQAYSMAGRARNRSKADYCAEEDHRHFLYREYLQIIQKYHPAVFIMENVKGILSSKVGGQKIFHNILRDLSDPDRALGGIPGYGYRIYSLVKPTVFREGMNPEDIDVHDFIIRAEDYGIPQARHRVILLGVRDDIPITPEIMEKTSATTVEDAICCLPPLRSSLSREVDVATKWYSTVKQHIQELHAEASARPDMQELANELRRVDNFVRSDLSTGALRLPGVASGASRNTELNDWYYDSRLRVILNSEVRTHMSSDLRRYVYAAAYAKAFKRSPKGHAEFALEGLRPNHENWETGKFEDRFRVQLIHEPATTVTSHISKDGHYFIHPDPAQCRSLTAREAARLQTFPDNYFFQGNRTEQFHQVGNAVPSLLARNIALVVKEVLRQAAVSSRTRYGESLHPQPCL